VETRCCPTKQQKETRSLFKGDEEISFSFNTGIFGDRRRRRKRKRRHKKTKHIIIHTVINTYKTHNNTEIQTIIL